MSLAPAPPSPVPRRPAPELRPIARLAAAVSDPLARRLRAVLLVNLVAQIGIVVTGGLVRLTGSGLGCPTWPQCVPGSYTPVVHQAQGYHKDIEFGNRMLTFAVVAASAAALIAVRRAESVRRDAGPQPAPRRRSVLWLGAVPILGVLAQAVLGGITVLTGLSPAAVASHFLLSMVLVALSTVLLLRLTAPTAGLPQVPLRRLAVAIAVLTGVILVLGTVVTGSGPHSGDATRPSRFGFDPRDVSQVHAESVMVFVGLLIGLLVAHLLVGAPRVNRRRGIILLLVTLGQAVIGYVQYFTGLPDVLVAMHMFGASVLVVAVVAVVAACLGLGSPDLAPGATA